VTVNGVSKWNGTNWSALGAGISGANANVEDFAFDAAGNVYVGGSFTTAGGSVSASCIAKWNGTSWSALGAGVGGTSPYVGSLLMDTNSGNLYVGGLFTTAGGSPANYIAIWDGASWSTMGGGMNNYVYSLAMDASRNIYASGLFTMAGAANANCIARWDGTGWSALGSGLNNLGIWLAPDNEGRLYVGGNFSGAGTNASSFVAQANVQPTLSRVHRDSNGSFTFNVLSTPNASARIFAASNLTSASWQPISTNTAPSNGWWQFTDTNASYFPIRFYRASIP
jgi:hypothetical protein